MTAKARQRKTPKQRAEETLAAAQRRVERIERALTHQKELVDTYERELEDAEMRLEYAEKDPALRHNTTPSTTNQAGATT